MNVEVPGRHGIKPLRLLLSEATAARIADDLATLGGIELLTIGPAGLVTSARARIEHPAPDVAYLSGDLFHNRLSSKMFDVVTAAPSPCWLHSVAAGTDSPAFGRLAASAVRVTRSDAQAPAIADYVLCHVLALLHPLAEARHAQAAASWQRIPFREIADTRWLIVGFGSIGTEIATRLRGFGAHLTVVRRAQGSHPLADETLPRSALIDALPKADVVVLACPLNADTYRLADQHVFAAMREGSIFVNVGRGALVDETQLRVGLDQGRPAFALLDVFEQEPVSPDAWLWTHPGVRMTAHCAGAGSGVVTRNDRLFLENLVRYRRGERLLGEVHPNDLGTTTLAVPADADTG